jgi:hypothetical protein
LPLTLRGVLLLLLLWSLLLLLAHHLQSLLLLRQRLKVTLLLRLLHQLVRLLQPLLLEQELLSIAVGLHLSGLLRLSELHLHRLLRQVLLLPSRLSRHTVGPWHLPLPLVVRHLPLPLPLPLSLIQQLHVAHLRQTLLKLCRARIATLSCHLLLLLLLPLLY